MFTLSGLWIWLFLFIIFIIIELLTNDIIVIWFAIGSVSAAFINLLGGSFGLQIVTFSVTSLLTLFVTRPKIVNYLKKTNIQTNSKAIIGKTGIVIKDISPHQVGKVKVIGQVWSAFAEGTIAKGTEVHILDIEGVKAFVRKK